MTGQPTITSGRGLGGCPNPIQTKENILPNELARMRILGALSTPQATITVPEEQREVYEDKKLVVNLSQGVEHILILENQARLLGLRIGTDTLRVRGPQRSLFVVVDRMKFATHRKPAPIKTGSSDAALLGDQISRLNLEIVA